MPGSIHTCGFPYMLGAVVELFRLRVEEWPGLRFVVTSQGRLPVQVLGDERRMRQILVNLLSNAVKFTEQGRIDALPLPDEPEPAAEPADPAAGLTQPTTADLDHVHDLAVKGKLRRLADMAGDLEDKDPKAADFWARIQTSAAAFDEEDVLQLLAAAREQRTKPGVNREP